MCVWEPNYSGQSIYVEQFDPYYGIDLFVISDYSYLWWYHHTTMVVSTVHSPHALVLSLLLMGYGTIPYLVPPWYSIRSKLCA
jgi:hypothetical protein